MSDPLGEIRAKFRRGQEHDDSWSAAYTAWLDRQPYWGEYGTDPSGWFVVRLRVREPPPIDLALIFADRVHNLRATLDHIVWHLVAEDARTKQTAFPVVVDRRCWPSAKRKYLDGFPDEWLHVVHDAQPFQMGEAAEQHPLYLLHHLDIAGKHRTVVRFRVTDLGVTGECRFNRPSKAGDSIEVNRRPPGMQFEDGVELVRVRAVSEEDDLRVVELVGVEDADIAVGPVSCLTEDGDGPLPNFEIFVGTVIEAIAPAFGPV